MNLERSSGVQLHLTSLPGGRLGREAYRFVDWLAEAGQSWWQVLPLVPPDRYHSPYKSRSAFAAWPGFLASPAARRVRARRSPTIASATATGSRTGRVYAGGGAIADQVRFEREWGALRAYAVERGVQAARRRRDLRRAGQRRPPLASGALPGRGGGGRPARRVHRRRPAVGQPAVRLAGDAPPPLPLVGRAPAPHHWLCSTSRGSTISAASSPTGRCPPARRPPRTGTGSAVRGGRCSTRWSARSGRCRWSPRISA